jgi:signal transduction histidine kinase
MKIFKTPSGQNRIVMFFILAILIPGILLGLLAFRGIKNDQALVAQQSRQSMLTAGKQIADVCNEAITRAEQDIYQWSFAQNIPLPGMIWSKDSMLTMLIVEHPCIHDAILFDSTNTPRLHGRNIAYVPDAYVLHHDHIMTREEQHLMEIGWQHEFQTRDLLRADLYYSDLFYKLRSPDAKCATLIARARIQKKLGQTEQAIATYRNLRGTCNDQRIHQQIPAAYAASLELSQLHLQAGDTVAAAEEMQVLYSALLNHPVNVGETPFHLITERARGLTELCRRVSSPKVDSAVIRTDSLRTALEQRLVYTQLLFALADRMHQSLSQASEAKDRFRRMSVEIHGQQTGISISSPTPYGYWVIIPDRSAILKEIIVPSIAQDDRWKHWEWKVMIENGVTFQQSAELPHNEDAVAVLLNLGAFTWTIQIWPKAVPLLDAIFMSSRRIYLLTFFVIITILVFGFIFTYQAINSEIQLARMKSGFISTVSHEFKSPLTTIRHMTEMLKDGKVQSEERKHEYYGIMLEQSQRLSHLIDNLLDFSKIEEGNKPFHFEETEMSPFLQDLANEFQKRIADANFSVGISIPEKLPTLTIDRHAMAQVFHNLLDNAYKYSGDSRTIYIAAVQDNGSIRIGIRDYGYGIPPTEVQKIFERFYRVGDALTSRIKGSGLGLTLVKEIVDAHAGKILVDSMPGMGSTFSVLLPTPDHGHQI